MALLSFSTLGSAKHASVDMVAQATQLARTRRPDLLIDGELQFDAAFVPAVAAREAPGSLVAGRANVFVFHRCPRATLPTRLPSALAAIPHWGR